MRRLVIPAEALLDLQRRLQTFPPRSHERRIIVQQIAEILNVRPTVIKSLFHGQLEPAKAQELKSDLLAAGVPI